MDDENYIARVLVVKTRNHPDGAHSTVAVEECLHCGALVAPHSQRRHSQWHERQTPAVLA